MLPLGAIFIVVIARLCLSEARGNFIAKELTLSLWAEEAALKEVSFETYCALSALRSEYTEYAYFQESKYCSLGRETQPEEEAQEESGEEQLQIRIMTYYEKPEPEEAEEPEEPEEPEEEDSCEVNVCEGDSKLIMVPSGKKAYRLPPSGSSNNYEAAKATCANYKYELATFLSEEEYNLMKDKLADEERWIALRMPEGDPDCLDDECDGKLHWDDAEQTPFQWEDYMSQGVDGDGECVRLKNQGQFNGFDCSKSLGYVCQKSCCEAADKDRK